MSKETRLNYLSKGGYRSGRTIKENGEILNIADFFGRVNSSMTGFDELSVASSSTLIDLKSVYPLSQLRDLIIASNGGAVTQADGLFQISTTADPDSEVVFRSVERGRYKAGIDAIAGIGLRAQTRPVGNQVIEWGYTDFTDGFVVGEDATGVFFGVYSAGVMIQKVYRDDWDDPLSEGTFVFDPSQLNIYRFPFRWYGRGPVRLDIAGEDGKTARLYRAHQMPVGSGLLTQDPNQPLSVRVANNGTAAAMTVECAGRNFQVRGDYAPDFRFTSEQRIGLSISTTFVPLVSARQRNSLYNSISSRIGGIEILTTANVLYKLVVLPDSLTGASWVSPSDSDSGVESAMEFDISATAVSGGIAIFKGMVAGASGNSSAVDSRSLPALELPADGGIVVLMARSISGSSTVTAGLRIREEW